ncbi:Formamidopyrimidine-DNA glycosylase N-terminal domain-domain-containing protein [Leucosporidium creatinivorum]|uniref:Formamidopyrimidine-DNA glycosylase N-terminal domain-domain-containing protein n=1 Tax=Leucosporidium creatinivorum TaxID=106004 RepID=A0A1Y2DRP2_9BASI|nr:Formamidopyrimidine-DNA glycosylase N-terminal domain-domain-containing protein [Leucosporidium creatinivorum]
MPELPEVERARRRLEQLAKGKRIKKVLANEDTIVYSGVTHAGFATACEGKIVKAVKRKGKNFYLVLSEKTTPIFHFGMSGTAIVKGEAGPIYRAPRAKTEPCIWPPKYAKAVLTFADAETGEEVGDWAFCDARRLGRIKLIEAEVPEEVPPLSTLGADPFLDMPSVEVLAAALIKRHAPIKAVLLDQNGPLCGIGNWMVDEILYQARLHPSHPSSALTLEEVTTLHHHIRDVTVVACAVNADAAQFPSHWLFSFRWGKGKKEKDFILPSGEKTAIKFVTVGGRTSAVIEAVQKLPKGVVQKTKAAVKKGKGKRKAKEESEEEGEEEDEEENEEKNGDESERGEEKVTREKATSPYFDERVKLDDRAMAEALPLSPSFKLPLDLSPTKPRASTRASRSRAV